MSGAVLDASAVLAFLKDEPGAASVAQILENAKISSVNLAEVYSFYNYVGAAPSHVEVMVGSLGLNVIEADVEQARLVGELRKMTASAGLSLADRFCLALALEEKAPAYTADRQWLAIAEAVGVEIILIR